MPVVCLCVGVNCDHPIHHRQRGTRRLLNRSSALELQLRCSRPLGLCSRSEIHAEPIDSNRTVEQGSPSKRSFEYARPSSMTGATCKNHTRRSSKFKTAVSGDDRIGGAGLAPPILSYTPNLVTSQSSKQRYAVMTGLGGSVQDWGGIDPPNPAVHPQFGHVVPESFLWSE